MGSDWDYTTEPEAEAVVPEAMVAEACLEMVVPVEAGRSRGGSGGGSLGGNGGGGGANGIIVISYTPSVAGAREQLTFAAPLR